MTSDAVRAYYASFGEREWSRLEDPDDGAVEFAVTKHILLKYLPANARVLDIGGGPGRYAIWLSKQGHRVVLADLSPELLSIARNKIAEAEAGSNIEAVLEADAQDLSQWDDGSFDAVLSLGPFYHMPNPGDRERAAAEMNRVLRFEGLAFVALIPRYTFLRRTLAIPDERCHLTQQGFIARLIEEGIFINDIPGRFTNGYGVFPDEVAPFFEKHGFTALTLLSAEGIVVNNQRLLSELATSDPDIYRAAFQLVLSTASDPSIFGMATHLLYVGYKTDR